MKSYRFRIVNVFARHTFGGNPLCVFEDARGLDAATMQALALQFNLSETTFILPSEKATAHVRIFTPSFEMPFAGHPTLGTAHVVRALRAPGNAVTLEMQAGIIPVSAEGDRWTLSANAPRWRTPDAPPAELAAMLGLPIAAIGEQPLWVDTGSDQLVIPIRSPDFVRAAAPRTDLMLKAAHNGRRAMAYLWAHDGPGRVLARFFFPKQAAIAEDPGTGSACANLGGWWIATGNPLPLGLTVHQGAAVDRPCELGLQVGTDRTIRVSGQVLELGRGEIDLPDHA